jgi:hypothetical protein
MINADTQLLYSSEYPHWDMDLSSTIFDLPLLSMDTKQAILGGNACRLFGLLNFVADQARCVWRSSIAGVVCGHHRLGDASTAPIHRGKMA